MIQLGPIVIDVEGQKHGYLGKMGAIIVGIAAFLSAFGYKALNPNNIGWLQGGDASVHYLGWEFFRNAPWQTPLGLNPLYGLEISNSIVYADSIPLIAIPLKVISPLLPPTFQYLGIWALICLALQSLASYILISKMTSSRIIPAICTVFFAFAPPLIYRMHGHLPLAGHFFILFAIYLAFFRASTLKWSILLTAAVLTNAYIFVMCLVFWAYSLTRQIRLGTIKEIVAILAKRVAPVIIPVSLAMHLAGYFTIDTGVDSDSYGYFKMNVLSAFDPDSWSQIFPDIPSGGGEHEGFAFLGAGSILLLVASAYFVLTNKANEYFSIVRSHWPLAFAMTGLVLFSITHRAAIGPNDYLFVDLPAKLKNSLGSFRSSGRMIWPVYYLGVLSLLYVVIKNVKSQLTLTLMLTFCAAIQIWDSQDLWLRINKHVEVLSATSWKSPFVSERWKEIVKGKKSVRIIPLAYISKDWSNIAYFASQHNLGTNAVYLARIDTKKLADNGSISGDVLRLSHYRPDSIYLLSNSEFEKAKNNLQGNPNYYIETLDGYNVVARKAALVPPL